MLPEKCRDCPNKAKITEALFYLNSITNAGNVHRLANKKQPLMIPECQTCEKSIIEAMKESARES